MELLRVEHLTVEYPNVTAVKNVSFSLESGQIYGLIGASGCGKSTIGMSLLGLVNGTITGGNLYLQDKTLLQLGEKDMEKIRWNQIAMVPQSAMNCLNPCQKIGRQIGEALSRHRPELGKIARQKEVERLLISVGLDPIWGKSYPHKLSGGMKQRAIIAMALSCQPKILISDEATTGLDVVVEAQILSLYQKIAKEQGIAILFISHDLPLVSAICRPIGVMDKGELVEVLDGKPPQHPYTKSLFSAQIRPDFLPKEVSP